MVVDNQLTVFSVCKKFSSQNLEGICSGYISLDLNSGLIRNIVDKTKEIINVLGINNSLVSLDIIYDKKVYLIDIGLMLDAKIDRLLEFASIDAYFIYLSALLCNDIGDVKMQLDEGYGLKFLYAEKSGILQKKTQKENVFLEKDVGSAVRPPASISDIIGWALIKEKNIDEVETVFNSIQSGDCFKVVHE